MSTALLDSFQLIVAGYLLYIAIKGNGQMYRFGNLSEADQAAVHKPLRILYAIGGVIALAEFGITSLKSSMFTIVSTEAGSSITQNFSISGFSFLTYDLLGIISTVLNICLILLLMGIFIWLYRKGPRDQKK